MTTLIIFRVIFKIIANAISYNGYLIELNNLIELD